MTTIPDFEILRNGHWRTFSAAPTGLGYAIFEASDRFWRERVAEAVLRIVGVGLILAGYIQWFLPDTMLQGDPVVARMALSGLFMGAGIALYLFASRGFRKAIHFAVADRQISVGRLNAKDHCLISRQIPIDRIQSLFVTRASADSPHAVLNLRLRGRFRTLCVMRGRQSEIEELHRHLCDDIQILQSIPMPDVAPCAILHSSAVARHVPVFRVSRAA